eukprot:TRINITY_DN12614_c3_g1_i1.p1 TRINITY_DN12614_c3_g1~~TRINITY_DN12614_c3_g1_i1.p1  ORF type:complete len:317 (-),score=19.08 TRINITY_DN12614_c3_g1_i1:154-1104(-)
MYEIVKMGISLCLDMTTDVVTSLTYFGHGQPYYGLFMLTVMLLIGLRDAVSKTSKVTWWLWSLKTAVPALGLLSAKVAERSEASASLVVLVLFFLKAPIHTDDGEPFMGLSQLITIALSLCSTLYAMYEGSTSSWQLKVLSCHADAELDFDKRWEVLKKKRYALLPAVYAATRATMEVLYAGCLAIAVRRSLLDGIYFVLLWQIMQFIIPCIAGCIAKKRQVHHAGPIATAISAAVFWFRWYKAGYLDTLPWRAAVVHDKVLTAISFIRCAFVWVTAVSAICSPLLCAVLIASFAFVNIKEDANYVSLASGERRTP